MGYNKGMNKGKRLTKKRCRVCGHEWFPRSPRRPGVCPKCKSANWDRKEGG